FLNKLRILEDRFPFIGEARGRGLFLALELVKNKETRVPLAKKVCERIFSECLKRGLLTMAYAPSFRLQPAMTIDHGTIDQVVEVLNEVFSVIERNGHWRD